MNEAFSMNMDATLVYQGDGIKSLGGGKVGGYLVRFSGPSDPDLVGDFFTKDTYFGTNTTPPVLYHHGMDGHMKARPIGSSTIKMDDVGLWIEAQLDMRDEYEKAVYDQLVMPGKAGWSSGASTYEREMIGKAGWLKTWIIGEASITPVPAEPRNAAVPIKALGEPIPLDIPQEAPAEASIEAPGAAEQPKPEPSNEKTLMDNQTPDAPAVDTKALDEAIARMEARFDEKLKSFTLDSPEPGKAAKSAPAIIDGNSRKWDNATTADLSFMVEFLGTADRAKRPSDSLVKALAARMDSAETDAHARKAYSDWSSSRGIKANEIMYSTLSSYGDEWVGVAYSSNLWEMVRSEAMVVSKLPSFEFPAGAESIVVPIESTDPTWYLVAQAASLSANPGGIPTNTVTSSQATTGKVTATLSKLGARVLYTGELNEDAMLPFVPQLQRQIAVSGAEYLESAVIDGDTDTSNTTNINHIAGQPGGTEYYLAFNGFRKNALITNTANARSGGVLTTADFLETAKLLGTAGQYAEPGKAFFLLDANTYWKALELDDVKTRDVFSPATLENGRLTGIYGFDVYQSFHMHKAQPSRKANTAGKIDLGTAGNNTTGSLLMVRPDHWQFGFRRRMTMETTRIAAADSTEIVTLMRASLNKRDTEASAITYNITL